MGKVVLLAGIAVLLAEPLAARRAGTPWLHILGLMGCGVVAAVLLVAGMAAE